jgi:hypothetical protein
MKKHNNNVSGFLGLNSQGPVLLKHAGRKSVQDANRHNGRVDGDNFFLSLAEERLLTRGSNIIPANTSSEANAYPAGYSIRCGGLDYHIHDLNCIELTELIRYREPGMSLFLYAEPTEDPDLDGLFDGIYQKGNRCLDKLIARLTDAKAA